jgi:hypothetical protein
MNITAVYVQQYRVEVTSSYGLVEGGGWYDKGDFAVVKLKDTVVNVTRGTRAIFDGWYEDGKLVSIEQSLALTVDRARSLKTKWRKQYFINVSTPYSTVESGGWYDEGSYAFVKLRETEAGNLLIRFVFYSWNGLKSEDRVSSSGVVSVYVDGLRMLKVIWKVDYSRIYALGCILIASVVAISYLVFLRRRRVHVCMRERQLLQRLFQLLLF